MGHIPLVSRIRPKDSPRPKLVTDELNAFIASEIRGVVKEAVCSAVDEGTANLREVFKDFLRLRGCAQGGIEVNITDHSNQPTMPRPTHDTPAFAVEAAKSTQAFGADISFCSDDQSTAEAKSPHGFSDTDKSELGSPNSKDHHDNDITLREHVFEEVSSQASAHAFNEDESSLYMNGTPANQLLKISNGNQEQCCTQTSVLNLTDQGSNKIDVVCEAKLVDLKEGTEQNQQNEGSGKTEANSQTEAAS